MLEQVLKNFIQNETKKVVKETIREEKKKDKYKRNTSFLDSNDNCNYPWTYAEDVSLQAEVELLITQIAQNHKRSVGAIKSRIRQKDLLNTF